MGFTVKNLISSIKNLTPYLQEKAEMLNSADAKLGDGDIGISLVRGVETIIKEINELPDDVGIAFLKCAQAFTRVSGSSYGTLLATGLMSAAKECKGKTEIPWDNIENLLSGALEAMIQRGKGALGQKTVLDVIEAARVAVSSISSGAQINSEILSAVEATLIEFRNLPAQQGRARMFGQRSVGLDDPGMLAFKTIVEGLVEKK